MQLENLQTTSHKYLQCFKIIKNPENSYNYEICLIWLNPEFSMEYL
jgi:hypothetical protein